MDAQIEKLPHFKGFIYIFEGYSYKINKRKSQKCYMECSRKCGVRMTANAEMTQAINRPGLHPYDQDQDFVEEVRIKINSKNL